MLRSKRIIDRHGGYRTVGADADVIIAAYVHRMFEMPDDVFAVRLFEVAEEAHEIDSCNAAFLGESPKRRVTDISRGVREGTTTGVRNRKRRLGGRDTFGDRSRSCMT